MQPLLIDLGIATAENFNEAAYLATNEDVRLAVQAGLFSSGRQHFDRHGQFERRSQRDIPGIEARRRTKMQRFAGVFRGDMPFVADGPKRNYLTPALREQMRIVDTTNVAKANYDGVILPLIHEFWDGLVLDCGCGKRVKYFDNILNYEIVDYDTTDVIGVGEVLPFKDASFDGVISNAVLEHVFDPFKCTQEIVRVLKPGGKVVISVPFLQPVHGYPHHYFNMTPQGLRTLFERYGVTVVEQKVNLHCHPICSLTWIVQSWARGLPDKAREQFMNVTIRDLMGKYLDLFDKPWVSELPEDKQFELASDAVDGSSTGT